MTSLRFRLVRGLATILLILFVAHWLAADGVIRYVAENQMATRLEHDADSLLHSLTVNEDGGLTFDSNRVGLVYAQEFSGHYFVIMAKDQEFRSPSFANQVIKVRSTIADGQQARYHADGPQGQPLLVLTRGVMRQGHFVSITTAEDLTEVGREIKDLRLGYLGLTAVFLCLAIALQATEVRRSLRPLAVIRQELQQVGQGHKTHIKAPAPCEIQPLVDEINRLLVLVTRRLHQSRTAIGNLAHALKTPLSILFRAASDPAVSAYPDIAQRLRDQTTTIHQRIDRELKRARLSGSRSPNALFNPRQDLEVLVPMLTNIYGDKALHVQWDAPERTCPFDRDDMLESIGNLADNACKWANAEVIVRVACTDLHLSVTVEDDGPGCPEPDLPNLTERGLRLDETRPGYGLGLAIVRDIAEFYGGNLRIDRSPTLGGLRVSLQF